MAAARPDLLMGPESNIQPSAVLWVKIDPIINKAWNRLGMVEEGFYRRHSEGRLL